MAPTVIKALAVTVSNRAAAGVYADKSGPVLAELLSSAGCSGGRPAGRRRTASRSRRRCATRWPRATTSSSPPAGPGSPRRDLTPEMTRRVLEREIPGIAEALRSAGAAAGVPSAILSRGAAGVAGRTLIVNLPGSTGGVRDGMAVLAPVLGHAVSQINGGDHPRADSGAKRLPEIA